MQAFLSDLMQLLERLLDAAIGLTQLPAFQRLFLLTLRLLMPLCAILILVRCGRSLLQGKLEQEVWGSLRLAGGQQLPLCHWENLVGRARRCDVILRDQTVSRTHAALIRDDRGRWLLHPLNPKNGVTVNGQAVTQPTPLQAQDIIGFGGVAACFLPLTEEEEQAQTARRTRPGRDLSPGVTLLLLTLFQSMLLASLTGSQLSEGTGTTLMICFGLVMGLQWLCYLLYRILRRTGFELETLAFFLSSLCLAVTAVSSPSTLPKQTACISIGLGLYFVMNLVLRDLEWAKRLQRPLAFFSAGLLVFNLLFGTKLFGAQNWVVLGPISFQPSEFVKIVFILVGAATLDKLFNRKNLLGSLLFSVFCVGCLALMSDFGTALIFFVAFLAIAFLRSGDLASVLFMLAAAAMACMLVLQYKSYIAQRFAVYRHVWEDPSNYGYQQTRTMSAIASGGLFGRGLGNGWLKNLGAANTDLVFGVLGEELGLIIALCAVLSILLMVLFAIRQAATARSSFYVICGCATGMLFLVQTMLNVFGSVDLLPLTGVTLPFVSVGGSSMISCWGLLAFLKASDTRQNASLVLRLPRRKRKRGAAAPSADAVPFAPSAPTQDSPDAADIAQETRVIHHLGTYPAPEEATRVPNAKGTASSPADEAPPAIPTPPAAGDSDADNWQQYFQWEEDDP